MAALALVIGSLCYIAVSVLCGCIVANWCWLYKSIEAHPAFFHRNPRATLTFGRGSVIYFLIINPLAIVVYQLCYHINALEVIHVLLNVTVNNSLAWVVWYRVYLTFWDVQISLALMDQKWAGHIDATYSHSNPYLEWRRTLGSSKAVSNYSLVWFSVLSLFQIIVIAGNPGNRGRTSLLLELAGYAVVLVHIAVVILYLPKYDDYFNIRGEMVRLCGLMFGSVLICFIFIMSADLNPPSLWFLLYNGFFMVGFIFAMNVSQFCMVFYDWNYPLFIWSPGQMEKLISESELKYGIVMPSQPSLTANARGKLSGGLHGRIAAGEVTDIMEKVRRMPGAKGRERGKSAGDRRSNLGNLSGMSDINTEKYGVRDIIEDTEGFQLFCRHLAREFSIENILFLIEVQQFITKTAENMKASGVIPRFDEELHLIFPKSVPHSSIVSGFNSVETHRSTNPLNFKDRLHLSDPYVQSVRLFLKYIPTEAPFGINISFHNRERLYGYFRFDDKSNSFDELKNRVMEPEFTPSIFGFSDDLSVTRVHTLTEEDMAGGNSDTEKSMDNGLSGYFTAVAGVRDSIALSSELTVEPKRSVASGSSSLSAMFAGTMLSEDPTPSSLGPTDTAEHEKEIHINIDDALVEGASGDADSPERLAAAMAKPGQNELIIPQLTHSESDMVNDIPMRTDKYMNEEEIWDIAAGILKKSLPKENRLLTIWNMSQREIIRLLNDSLNRFAQTEAYKRWHKSQKFARLATQEHSIKRTRSNPLIGFNKGRRRSSKIDSSRSQITRGMSFAGIT